MKRISLVILLGIMLPMAAQADGHAYCISVWNSNDNGKKYFIYTGQNDDWSMPFTIPDKDDSNWPMFWVGDHDNPYNDNLGNNNAKSENKSISTISLVYHHHTVGLAAGAKGTLHIYDNSTSANLYPTFEPEGYGVKWGEENSDWISTPLSVDATESTIWWSDVLLLTSEQVTNCKYYVGLKTATDYVFSGGESSGGCSETKSLSSMGVRTSDNSDTWLSGNMSANTRLYGKFRIWINHSAENFSCHFVPFYRITFNVNGGQGNYSDVAFSTIDTDVSTHTIDLSTYTPTKANATLIGWKDEISQATYSTTQTITNIATDMNLVAQWAETKPIYADCNVSDIIGGNHNLMDLVLAPGVTLTATDNNLDESTYFHSVTIQAGAMLDIPEGTVFNTYSLVLEGGAEDNGSYQFTFPKVRAVGGINIYGGDDNQVIYYDYLLNNNQWYALCLPVDVATSEISFLDGREAQYDENYLLQEYNTSERAAGRTGWVTFAEAPTTLTAGKGYNICALPADGQSFARLRIPLRYDLREGEAYTDQGTYKQSAISVISPEASNGANKGWNLIGNPFLVDYTKGFLAIEGNWLNFLEYATIPNNNGTNYQYAEAGVDLNVVPFHTFFVQVEDPCSLSFAYRYCLPLEDDDDDDPGFFAPRHVAVDTPTILRAGLTLTGNNQDDRVGLRFSDKYTTDYDFNGDLSKWMNKDLNVYALLGNEKVAFLANPESVLTNISIGYKATSAGEYTFALDTRHDYSKIQSILLTDAEEGVTTDLKIGSYSFQTNKGTFDARFSVSVVIANAPTEIDVTKATNGTQKMLIDGEFVILKNNQLFNAQGAQIQ